MLLDLHVHSTASDGTMTAEELVATAVRRGLTALAITDHDSVDALPAALSAVRGNPLLVIPGVELSTVHDGRDVHILGYFVDPNDGVLRERLAELRDARRDRASAMVDLLRDAGYDMSLDEVLLLAEGGSVGRSHVARALVSGGHAETVPDAFDRLIGRGRPFYVPKPVAGPVEVIRTILESDGVPVLAHPGVTNIDDAIPALMDAGLMGLEAYHAEHTPAQREHYEAYARHHGLLVTGGSDFHGHEAPGGEIGAAEMPASVLHELLAAAGRSERYR